MRAVLQTLELVGGLGIFLIGMRWMSDGIQKRAGSRLRSILHTMTENRFAAILTGVGVTALLQSSSGSTVLLVSLVNAGLVTLQQAIGVIMGANTGTTLTAWIVSIVGFQFRITDIALPAIAIALPMYFAKSRRFRETADILIGFGLLFLGLDLMKEAVPDIGANPEALAFLRHWAGFGFWSVLIFIVVGGLLTIVVQSSSAAVTITITMAFRGWIDFPIAAAIVLGENIGTTVTAYLASLPMDTNARRAARAHLLFNVFGVLWMLIVFYPFTNLVDWIMPGSAELAQNIPIHLSLFHTLFNVTNTIVFLPFVALLHRAVVALVPERRQVAAAGEYRIVLIPPRVPDAINSNLVTIRHELSKMSGYAVGMLQGVMEASKEPSKLDAIRVKLEADEQYVDDMQEAITQYLTDSMGQAVSSEQARSIHAAQRIAHEIEGISDGCYSIGLLLDRLHRKGRRLHADADTEILSYTAQVMDFLNYNGQVLERKIKRPDLSAAEAMEAGIDKVRKRLRRRSRKSIERDAKTDVKGELIFIDIIRHLEHIGDHSLNISEAVIELS